MAEENTGMLSAGKNVVGGAVKGNINMVSAASKGAERTSPGVLYALIDRLSTAIIEAVKGGDIKKAETLAANLEKAKKTIEEKTGLPVEKPSGNDTPSKLYHAFGEGLTPTPGAGVSGMVMGGITNAIGEYALPDNPLGRFLISVGVPMAANAAVRGGMKAVSSKIASGQALDDIPPSNYKLTKAEITGDPVAKTSEMFLKEHEKTAGRYKDFTRERNAGVFEDLERFSKTLIGPKRNSSEVGTEAAKAFTNYREGLLGKFKADNKKNFDAALKELGDERIVDVSKVRDALVEKIRQYDGMMADPVSARKATALKKMYDNMFHGENAGDLAGTPYKATLREVQNALENYGQVAYGKGGIFNDIAPGSDIGDAKFIANAWQGALDDAAKTLVGPDQKPVKALVDARRTFAVGAERLKNISTSPVMQLIEKTNLTTNPEKIYEQFLKMSPAERSFYTRILADYPDTVNQIRKAYFDSIVESGKIPGHSVRGAAFDPTAVVTKFDEIANKDPTFARFLFPDNRERAQFYSRLKDMRSMAETGASNIQNTGKEAVVAGVAAAALGHPGTAMTVRGAERMLRDAFTDKDVLFDTLILGKKPPSAKLVDNMAVGASEALGSGYGTNRIAAGAQIAGQQPAPALPEIPEGSMGGIVDTIKGIPEALELGPKNDILSDPLLQDDAPETDITKDPLLQDEPDSPFDEAFMDRVKAVESGGNPLAISKAGAMGPYQFMPGTQQEVGLDDPFDEEKSRKASRAYLEKLYKQFGGDKRAAVAAYNMGPGAYQRYLEGKQSMPKETEDYLRKLLNE